MASCYHGIFPALKKSGEWTVYLGRSCRYLQSEEGKCSIHTDPRQSLICKSYDAHNCWYIDAFSREKYTAMIPFSTEMLIWYEKRYKLIENRFSTDMDWNELCTDALSLTGTTPEFSMFSAETLGTHSLSFRKSASKQFLFMPPYKRPENINHFELLAFRLGFPGVYLAVAENCWAYLVTTGIKKPALDLLRCEYYPAIEHRDFVFSFSVISKELSPFSETGEQWVILRRSELEMLKSMTVFDRSGNIKRLPGTAELLEALKTMKPDRAA